MKVKVTIPNHPWLEKRVVGLSYADPLRGASPDIELGIVRENPELPVLPGEIVEVAIAYEGEQYQLKAGSFEVDKIEMTSTVVTIQATGLPLNNPDIKRKRDNDYSETLLSEILQDVGDRYGLTPFTPNIPEIGFSNLQQTQQSDLEFLQQLAGTLGAVFKIESARLIFTLLTDLELRSPTFSLKSSGLIRKDSVSSVKRYQFLDYEVMLFGELETTRVEDKRVSNGAIAFHRGAGLMADDENLMVLGAKEKLRQFNGEGWELDLQLAGNPYLVAGSTFLLDGEMAIVEKVTHRVIPGWNSTIVGRFIPG